MDIYHECYDGNKLLEVYGRSGQRAFFDENGNCHIEMVLSSYDFCALIALAQEYFEEGK